MVPGGGVDPPWSCRQCFAAAIHLAEKSLPGQVAVGSNTVNRATRSPTRNRRNEEKPAVAAGIAVQNVKSSQLRKPTRESSSENCECACSGIWRSIVP
jgi:hypothetical protein